ncbi:dehydrogenase [Parazoarcus communis]|uniref:Dehydrogenase n=1 Tax=Parazoarcus communis TaxID=41977 RepID=A0A2U8GN56_9RHOO|nr:zinc-binding alcohol dehydrogenase [Parazoarcus communis]AWI75089.1 dehydrogenase [Parazoarcus communis]
MRTHGFWTVAPGCGEIRDTELEPPAAGALRVRALYSGISRGTERLVFDGEVPESEYARMRAPFQEGEFPAPVKYGYASVGVVEAAGSDAAARALLGKTVFCLYPHQCDYVVPLSALTVLPEGLPAARAVLAANMETAVNALWDAAPAVGDRIAVIGAGVVGCLVAWLCSRLPGCRVELIDIDASRAQLATALGLRFRPPSAAAPECDLVIHASGQAAGLRDALRLAGQEAMVLEMSWFGRQAVSLPLGEAFHVRRLTLRSSQVGSIPPGRLPRWDYRRRLELALSLLTDPVLDALISGESSFFDLPTVMASVLDRDANTLCHRIRYPSPAG